MGYIIYTDLDGTLLDHDNYSFEAAIPALRLLKQQKFPVIPVTSKTRAEVLPLREELELNTPMIVENGAAVFLPEELCSDTADLTAKMDGYYVKAFSPDKHYWASVIGELHQRWPKTFTAFSEMSPIEISELTGLPTDKSELAGQREFSDPLHWYGNDHQLKLLAEYCLEQGIHVVRGGRFVHLLKGSDKGMAVRWLHQFMLKCFNEPMTSIGLGDGENDLALLDEVDLPVQIRSATHEFPDYQHDRLYRTSETGPAGWAEAIFKRLKKH